MSWYYQPLALGGKLLLGATQTQNTTEQQTQSGHALIRTQYINVDCFDRPDEVSLAGNWSTPSTTCEFDLLSNKIKPQPHGSTGAFTYTNTVDSWPTTSGQFAQITIRTSGMTEDGDVGIGVRMTDAANTGYFFMLDYYLGGNYYLNKNDTTLLTGAHAPVDGDVLRLEVNAQNQVKAYINGSGIGPYDDSASPITGARVGLVGWTFVDYTNTMQGDDWQGGSWATPKQTQTGKASIQSIHISTSAITVQTTNTQDWIDVGPITTTSGSTLIFYGVAAINAGSVWDGVPTDTYGNTWIEIHHDSWSTITDNTLWYSPNISGVGANHSVSMGSTLATKHSAVLIEIVNGATTGILDKYPNILEDVSSPYLSPQTGTISQASELVLAFFATNTPAGADPVIWGSGFNTIQEYTDSANVTLAVGYLSVTSIGSYQASITEANAIGTAAYSISLKDTGGNVTQQKTQTGKAKITVTTQKTQTGKSRIQQTVASNTQTGKARIQIPSPRTDNFNRANESPLAGLWTKTFTLKNSTLGITSNQVVYVSGTHDAVYHRNNETFPAAQFSRWRVVNTSTGIGVGVHCKDASNGSGIYVVWIAGRLYYVTMVNGGSSTSVDVMADSASTNDILEISITGNGGEVTVKRNDVITYQTTDTTGIVGGSPGIVITDGAGSIGDDWFGGGNLITGKARIRKTVQQTQTGKACIRATTTRTQTGKGDIRKTAQQTQTGKARIQVTVQGTDGVLINYSPAILNGGFETDGTGGSDVFASWNEEKGNDATIAKETSIVHSGSASAKSAANTGYASLYQTILTLGKVYRLSLWARSVSGTSSLRVYLGVGTYQDLSLTTTWTQFTVQGVCSGDTLLRLYYLTGNSGYIDDVSLEDLGKQVPGKARVTASTQKTQTGKARIQVTASQKTQTGKARISKTVASNTQTGKARITAITQKTQTCKASIRVTVATNTQTGKARIQQTVATNTQTGKARIQKTVASNTQAGKARIQQTVASNTQVGKAKISETTQRIQSGKAAIQNTTSRTQTGKAFLYGAASQYQTGKAAIQNTATSDQTGKARIQQTVATNTQTGKARIQKTVASNTQAGKARIQQTVASNTQVGKAKISETTQRIQSGKAAIQNTTSRTQTGKAFLYGAASQYQTGKAAIQNTATSDQTGKARIQQTVATNTQTGKARIQKTVASNTQAGKARIQQTVASNTQVGKAKISETTQRIQSGKAAIQNTTSRTQTGKAFLYGAASQYQTGKAAIQNTATSDQTGKARIQQTVATNTQTGKARIQKTVASNTQAGKARITVATQKTQDGKAKISETTQRTQTGKAAIYNTTQRTQTGKARVQVTVDSNTQTGKAYIQIIVGQTQNGIARIRVTAPLKTQAGKAKISETTQRTQSGKARIQLTAPQQTRTGKARITVTTLRTQSGKSRVTVTTQKIQAGKAAIYKTQQQFQTGKARIQVTTQKTQAGKTRVTVTTSRTQAGKSAIYKTQQQPQTGLARVTFGATEVQTGKAVIRKTIQRTQTGITRIQLTGPLQTESGKARIKVTVSKTQTGKAKISETTQKIQTGKARIRVTVTKTQTGLAEIAQTAPLQTRTGKARVQITSVKLQTGKASIVVTASLKTQTGKSRVQATNTREQFGKGAVGKTVQRTQTGMALITDKQFMIGKARVQVTVQQIITGIAEIARTAPAQTQSGRADISNTRLTGKARITAPNVQQTQSGAARIKKGKTWPELKIPTGNTATARFGNINTNTSRFGNINSTIDYLPDT